MPEPPDSILNLDLRRDYNDFLRNESIIENCDFSDKILITDFDGLKNVCKKFCDNKSEHFASNTKLLTDRLTKGFFEDALSQLERDNAELYNLSNFIIKILLVNQLSSYTNGTLKDMIGLACLDFKDNYNEQDFLELIVHQMTHMILFIDDYSCIHMPEENKNVMIETGLKFVLGGTKFPAYIIFHSFIVGVEVLCFRLQSTGLEYIGNYHGSTGRIIDICKIFKRCLLNESGLITSRGQYILGAAFEIFDNIVDRYTARNS